MRRRHVWTYIILILSLQRSSQSGDSSGGESTAAIETFAAVSAEIHRELDNTLPNDPVGIRRTASYRKMSSAASRQVWYAAIENTDAMIQVLGLLCLQEHCPDEAFLGATRMLLAAEQAGSPHLGFAVPIVRSGANNVGQIETLAAWLDAPTCASSHRVVMIATLNDADLAQLLNVLSQTLLSPDLRAYITSECLTRESMSDNAELRSTAARLLEDCKLCPGEPRAIYLSVAEIPKDEIDELLRSVLVDESIDDALVIPSLLRFAKSNRSEIERATASSSPSRRVLIERILERTSAK